MLPLTAFVGAFLVWPLLWLGATSLRPGPGALPGPGPGWDNYRTVFQDEGYRQALGHSLLLSLAVAAGSTALCLAPAWVLVRREFWGKPLVRALFTLPMSFSGIIVGFLTVVMLGRVGVVPRALERLTGHDWLAGSAYQFGGLVCAYAYFEIPRATLSLESALRKLDPRWEATARTLGAGAGQRFFLVVLPLLWPALVRCGLLTFNVSLGSFGAVLVLSRRFSLLPLEVFQQIISAANFPLAAAMSVLLVGVALFTHAMANRWVEAWQGRHGLAPDRADPKPRRG